MKFPWFYNNLIGYFSKVRLELPNDVCPLGPQPAPSTPIFSILLVMDDLSVGQ